MMLIAFYFVKSKDRTAAFRQLLQCSSERDAIDHTGKFRIILPEVPMKGRRFGVHRLVERNCRRRFPAPQFHQNGVDRYAIKPGRKCSVAAERSDRPENLQESFLGEVLGLSDVFGHEEADRVDAILVLLKQRGKGLLIACLSALDKI